jgi:hypothetical protein
MRISDCIEANLHKLDNTFIKINREHRLSKTIDDLNKKVSQCSCEINGMEFNGHTIEPIPNPFARKTFLESNASIKESNSAPMIWRTMDNSLHLEVTF